MLPIEYPVYDAIEANVSAQAQEFGALVLLSWASCTSIEKNGYPAGVTQKLRVETGLRQQVVPPSRAG